MMMHVMVEQAAVGRGGWYLFINIGQPWRDTELCRIAGTPGLAGLDKICTYDGKLGYIQVV